MAKIDRTISFDEELYKWLIKHIDTIRPATTIPSFINWLVEKEKIEDDILNEIEDE